MMVCFVPPGGGAAGARRLAEWPYDGISNSSRRAASVPGWSTYTINKQITADCVQVGTFWAVHNRNYTLKVWQERLLESLLAVLGDVVTKMAPGAQRHLKCSLLY